MYLDFLPNSPQPPSPSSSPSFSPSLSPSPTPSLTPLSLLAHHLSSYQPRFKVSSSPSSLIETASQRHSGSSGSTLDDKDTWQASAQVGSFRSAAAETDQVATSSTASSSEAESAAGAQSLVAASVTSAGKSVVPPIFVKFVMARVPRLLFLPRNTLRMHSDRYRCRK